MTARQGRAPRASAILRRVLAEARGRLWTAYAALACVFGESIVDAGAIPVLLALVFLAIDPSSVRASGLAAQSSDWFHRLALAAGYSDSHRLRSLLLFTALLFLAWAAKCAFGFGRSYLSQLFSQNLIRELRARLYDHLLRQSLAFHKSRETGDLLSRLSNDVTVLQRALGVDLLEAARTPVTILIALGLMIAFEWRLALVSIACVPLVSLFIARSGDRMRLLAREVQSRLGRLNAFVQERLSGIETVQIFGTEARESARFREINDSNFRANMRVAKMASLLSPLVELISAFGMLFLIFFAGYLTIKGMLTVPKLLAFAYAGQRLGSNLGLFGKIWLSAQQAAAAGDRIFELLDAHEEVPERRDATELGRIAGRLAFHGVGFRYGEGEPVLRDLHLAIEPGQVVALVGASGAGKTSLANLIPRFHDPSEGRIEVDGVDISSVTLRSLRSQIGIVPQEPILFDGSIRDNIAYGRPEATDEEIRQAAQAANAAEFIEALPGGYSALVGERAAKLSGGQRQRIAIARALLCDPRILILDEATSSLDAESEALVQNALDRLMDGRTTLIIAHRLSTIQRADRILVLANGRIVEDGTHEGLLRKHGTYRRLYEAQLLSAGQQAPVPP